MRRLLALITVCLVASGCAGDPPSDPPSAPVSSPSSSSAEPTVEPVADPGEPRSDLHLDCAGEGAPTIVLVAGLNTSGGTFRDLRRRLARTAQACFYDRAGIGDSDPLDDAVPDPSPGSAAADLRATLAAAGIEPPYVLLGWSYGGLVTQAYAADFPDELAGLVLEDTSVREQFTGGGLTDASFVWQEGGRVVDNAKARRELADLDLGDVPVVALSQDADEPWMPAWWRSHDRLARATSEGVHAIATGSGHAMHQDVPRLVLRAVEAVWAAASTGAGLPGCAEVFHDQKVRCRV